MKRFWKNVAQVRRLTEFLVLSWFLQKPRVVDAAGDGDLVEIIEQRQGVLASGVDKTLRTYPKTTGNRSAASAILNENRVFGPALKLDAFKLLFFTEVVEPDKPLVLHERFDQLVHLLLRKTKLLAWVPSGQTKNPLKFFRQANLSVLPCKQG